MSEQVTLKYCPGSLLNFCVNFFVCLVVQMTRMTKQSRVKEVSRSSS